MNIEPLHQFIYDQGSDPIEWAARLIAIQFDAQESVIVARFHDPKAFPGYHLDLDSMSTARRAIAQLLDAGWTPPSLPSGEQEPA